MSGQVVRATLTELPMKVPSAGLSVRRCGLRNFNSSMTTGKSVSSTSARRLPHVRRPTGRGVGGCPAGKRRVDSLRVKALDQVFALFEQCGTLRRIEPALEMFDRVEAQDRRPARLLLVRRLHERAEIARKRLLDLLDAVGEGAIRVLFARLDRSDDHFGRAVLNVVLNCGLAGKLHYQAAFDQRRGLSDQGVVLGAVSPLPQRLDRSEAPDRHRFLLIGRRRPVLKAGCARRREHRRLIARVPLGKRRLILRLHSRAENEAARRCRCAHGRWLACALPQSWAYRGLQRRRRLRC